jgi:hypothetical protein
MTTADGEIDDSIPADHQTPPTPERKLLEAIRELIREEVREGIKRQRPDGDKS